NSTAVARHAPSIALPAIGLNGIVVLTGMSAKAHKEKTKMSDGLAVRPAAVLPSLPFQEAAAQWLETRNTFISPKTYHDYELNIKTLSAFFGEMCRQKSMAIRFAPISTCEEASKQNSFERLETAS